MTDWFPLQAVCNNGKAACVRVIGYVIVTSAELVTYNIPYCRIMPLLITNS